MPLFIKDDKTTELVCRLAKIRGVSKTEAVRGAVEAELQREAKEASVWERLQEFWQAHPPPEPSGELADKAFYDDLSGDP